MTKFDAMRPALLQISDEENAFLVDMVALAGSKVLDEVLTEIFNADNSVLIGFSFKSDLDVFAKCLPTMSFYRLIKHFIDAQTFYSKLADVAPGQ